MLTANRFSRIFPLAEKGLLKSLFSGPYRPKLPELANRDVPTVGFLGLYSLVSRAAVVADRAEGAGGRVLLGYGETAQIECLRLMAKKIYIAQSASGDMPETGLDVLNQGGGRIEGALAKPRPYEALSRCPGVRFPRLGDVPTLWTNHLWDKRRIAPNRTVTASREFTWRPKYTGRPVRFQLVRG